MNRSFDLLSLRPDSAPLCPSATGLGWLTGAELRADVAALTERVEAVSPASSSNVVLVLSDRYHLLVACLTAWRLGLCVVLPPNYQSLTLKRVVQASGALQLWTDLVDLEPTIATEIVHSVPDATVTATAPRAKECVVEAGRHILTIFTSGTTGEHQRCAKTAAQLFGEAQVLVNLLHLDGHNTLGATVPGYHLYGLLFTLLVPLFAGASFIRPALFQPADVKHAIERYQVSDLVTVPAHISALLAAGTPLAPLERVVSSGAVLEPTLAEEFARHSGAQVIDVLGSTESGGIAWRNPCVGAPYVPLPGVSVAADPNGQLLLCSPFLATDDWETMNDRVRMVPGGFEHLGRRDGVIKLGGKRLAMQELELRARGLPGINDAVGLVQPSTRLRGTEVWLAVATTDQSWDAGALKQALAQYFDPAVLPRRYRICETLPRNALGKVERSQLVQLFSASGPTPETCFQLPKPDVKQDAEAELFVSNFKVPVTWVYFCGHFPNAPILPGVVQLSEIVLPSIALAWRELRILDEAPVLKYQRPIQPGMQLALHACRQRGGSQVQFELRAGNELASTGRLRFRTL